MKLYLQPFAFILLFLLIACEENDPTDNIDNTDNNNEKGKIKIEDVAEGELKAIVNGKTKSAESVTASLSTDNFSIRF